MKNLVEYIIMNLTNIDYLYLLLNLLVKYFTIFVEIVLR